MEQLNRLGWAEGIAVRAFGVSVGVRVTDAAALREIVPLLPPGWRPAPPLVRVLYSYVAGGDGPRRGVRRMHLLYRGSALLAGEPAPEPVLDKLEVDLRQLVALASPNRVFVHAGAVGWNGRAILIPGRSVSGKSTLVAEFVRRRATYYSDEYAVIDRRGRVHPYAKPVSMRDFPGARPVDVPVSAFGGVAGTEPLPVGAVVVTGYRRGARFRPQRLSAGAGALELLQHSVAARYRPQRILPALGAATAGATVLRGPRGEAAEAAERILEEVGQE